MKEDLNTRHTLKPNGELIRTYRRSLNLTQREFAKLSGYSERLIIKAESGAAVRYDSLETIADTFCERGIELTVNDLSTNPLSLAKAFVRAYKMYEERFMEFASHLIADDVKVEIAGDQEVIPFAGIYTGHGGFVEFWQRFFGVMFRPEKEFFNPEFFVNGNEVAAFGKEMGVIRGQDESVEIVPSFVALRFVIKDGKISEFYDLYDTQSATKYIEEFRSRLSG